MKPGCLYGGRHWLAGCYGKRHPYLVLHGRRGLGLWVEFNPRQCVLGLSFNDGPYLHVGPLIVGVSLVDALLRPVDVTP